MRDKICIANIAALIAPAFPMAIVATGTPAGICTDDNNESKPPKVVEAMGTATTGSVVWAATTPARCAAAPAKAIITLISFFSALIVHFIVLSGDL